MTVEEVLREMHAIVAMTTVLPGDMVAQSHEIARWLEVLQPALAQPRDLWGSEAGVLRAEVERLRQVVRELEMREARGVVTGWASTTPDPLIDVEVIPLRSDIPLRLLRDLTMAMEMRADHEGQGEVRFDYRQVPPDHRLQGLLTLMAALSHRIEMALGTETYLDILRGVIAKRGGWSSNEAHV